MRAVSRVPAKRPRNGPETARSRHRRNLIKFRSNPNFSILNFRPYYTRNLLIYMYLRDDPPKRLQLYHFRRNGKIYRRIRVIRIIPFESLSNKKPTLSGKFTFVSRKVQFFPER